MELIIQLIAWVVFAYLAYYLADNLNVKYDMEFDNRIWAAIGFLFGIFGVLGLGAYAYYKIKHK